MNSRVSFWVAAVLAFFAMRYLRGVVRPEGLAVRVFGIVMVVLVSAAAVILLIPAIRIALGPRGRTDDGDDVTR